jgi:hypothetical protein
VSLKTTLDRVLNDRSVRLWTVVGGITGLLGIVLTVILVSVNADAGSHSAAPPPHSTPSTAPVSTNTPTSPSPSSPNGSESPPPSSPPPSSPPPTLTSPVRIPLGQLCDTSGQVYICGQNYGGTVQVGNKVFTYHGEDNGFAGTQPPNWDLVLGFPANTCSSLVINFAVSSSRDGTVNVRVIQTTDAEQKASVSYGHVGRLVAKLDGGPFYLQANSTTGAQVFADGYAICSTDSGLAAN